MIDDPNEIAAQFISEHPDWDIIFDDEMDVFCLKSPLFNTVRVEITEESQQAESGPEQA